LGSYPEAVPGDVSEFVRESPDGVDLFPGAPHVKTWTVRNAGVVVWEGRSLWRTGRVEGDEVPSSEEFVAIPRTVPGDTVTMQVTLHCAQVPGTRVLRFKMVDADGQLCFPEDDWGLSVEVTSHRHATTGQARPPASGPPRG
jgi:hypothetical protein